jgi:DNA-directed RNA polymerase III subunit RPC2
MTKKNTKNVISSFANLDVDGLACPGSLLRAGDIYINKYTSTTYQNSAIFNSALPDSSFHPSPMIWKCQKTDCCVVDNVVITTNEFNHMVVRLLIRHTREPELGDKFSSRHGQKGVVGNIVNMEDMPFSEQGISPDLIMNPHGFPSRLTVGKMIELIGSKAASLSGNHIYGSAFGEPAGMASSVNIIGNCLAENGFSYNGKDFLTSGVTGEPLEVYIFIGNVYYQKLKHMVSEKLHSRARGPKVLLTRQPTEGRSRDGGLRFGEMERDCLISYGSATLLLERLMISSDLTVVYICTRCKVMGYWNNETRSGSCSLCGQCNNLERIYLPYACKLLFQELQSMNITSKLKISD